MANRTHANIQLYNSIEKVEAYWKYLKPKGKVTNSYKDKWIALSPLFDSLSLQCRVCITLWDALSNKFIFATDQTNVLGHNAANFTNDDGVDYTMSRFHPDHLEATLIMQNTAIKYCLQHKNYLPYKIIINQDCRYLKSDDYIQMLQQITVVETDEDSNPLLFLSYIYDISHLKKVDSANLIINTPDEIILWSYKFSKKKLLPAKPFTFQEKKILYLLSTGKFTKEIGEKLRISPHTVDTHRRNLLSKTCCVDTTALVTYCKMVGLI